MFGMVIFIAIIPTDPIHSFLVTGLSIEIVCVVIWQDIWTLNRSTYAKSVGKKRLVAVLWEATRNMYTIIPNSFLVRYAQKRLKNRWYSKSILQVVIPVKCFIIVHSVRKHSIQVPICVRIKSECIKIVQKPQQLLLNPFILLIVLLNYKFASNLVLWFKKFHRKFCRLHKERARIDIYLRPRILWCFCTSIEDIWQSDSKPIGYFWKMSGQVKIIKSGAVRIRISKTLNVLQCYRELKTLQKCQLCIWQNENYSLTKKLWSF